MIFSARIGHNSVLQNCQRKHPSPLPTLRLVRFRDHLYSWHDMEDFTEAERADIRAVFDKVSAVTVDKVVQ